MDRDKAIVKFLLEWHKENRRTFPWRETRDPYRVLVAEFFLQRTPANRIASIFPKFIKEYSSPERLYRLWIIRALNNTNGKIPDSYDSLILLPGVGEYTASAILCFGFGRDTSIVDVNVVRVLSRIYGIDSSRTGNVLIKELATRLIPKGRAVEFNESLIDFAMQICKKIPTCSSCSLRTVCNYVKIN